MIAVVDYGFGNAASVKNMLYHIGVNGLVTKDSGEIYKSDKLILPGIGAFDAAMARLGQLNLIPVIKDFAEAGKPILGICLGAQLIMDTSEEGKLQGLKLIKGTCKKFNGIHPLKIPHMSWSDVMFTQKHPLFDFAGDTPRFYFVHSYHLVPDDKTNIFGVSRYGFEFVCAIGYRNVMGVQFHPEKSHRYGAKLLKNFAAL
jgi:glutamine amidotransferase